MKQRIIITDDDNFVAMPIEELIDDLQDDFIHVLDDLEHEWIDYFRKNGLPPPEDARSDKAAEKREDWYANATDYLDMHKSKAIGKFLELMQQWLKGELEWQK